jgi:hypothetical protein
MIHRRDDTTLRPSNATILLGHSQFVSLIEEIPEITKPRVDLPVSYSTSITLHPSDPGFLSIKEESPFPPMSRSPSPITELSISSDVTRVRSNTSNEGASSKPHTVAFSNISHAPPSASCISSPVASVDSQGLLIDYDYSSFLSPSGLEERGHRTVRFLFSCLRILIYFQGTFPFMSIDLHDDPTTKHLPIYDLQSFFYVFIWICIIYKAPDQPCIELPPILKHWTDLGHTNISAHKLKHTLNSNWFRGSIGEAFTAYFADLVDFADEFRAVVLFSKKDEGVILEDWSTNTERHDRAIRLFDEKLEALRKRENSKPANSPQLPSESPSPPLLPQAPQVRRSLRKTNAATTMKIRQHLLPKGCKQSLS